VRWNETRLPLVADSVAQLLHARCSDHHEEHHRERHLSLRIPAEPAASVRQEASAATAESPRNIRR
jgi:hypothetical protein